MVKEAAAEPKSWGEAIRQYRVRALSHAGPRGRGQDQKQHLSWDPPRTVKDYNSDNQKHSSTVSTHLEPQPGPSDIDTRARHPTYDAEVAAPGPAGATTGCRA